MPVEIKTAIHLFKLIIQKITSEREKNATFRIRHYNDAIKILEKWPEESFDNIQLIENHFKDNFLLEKNQVSTDKKSINNPLK